MRFSKNTDKLNMSKILRQWDLAHNKGLSSWKFLALQLANKQVLGFGGFFKIKAMGKLDSTQVTKQSFLE